MISIIIINWEVIFIMETENNNEKKVKKDEKIKKLSKIKLKIKFSLM